MSNRLNAYATPPQLERKAAKEIREAGIRAYLPMETISGGRKLSNGQVRPYNRKVPIVRSCVFAEAKPPFAEHVKGRIGPKQGNLGVSRGDIAGLYKTARAREFKPKRVRKFVVGDQISIKVGPLANLSGTVIEDRGRFYRVAVSMFGKTHTQAFSEIHLEKRIIRDG
jgi:ribosomal protein L21E